MNNYQNVGKGLNRMFIATLGMMACAILGAIPFVGIVFTVGMLVFYVMDLTGYYLAGKDIKACKIAFIIRIISVILSTVSIFVKMPNDIEFVYATVETVLPLVAMGLVFVSVSKALRESGAGNLAKEGIIILWVYVIFNVVILLLNEYTSAVGEVLWITLIFLVLSFVVLLMQLRFLYAGAEHFKVRRVD